MEEIQNLMYALEIHHISSEPIKKLLDKNKKLEDENRRLRKCHLRYEEVTGIDLLLE